jgi:hypothetical protein
VCLTPPPIRIGIEVDCPMIRHTKESVIFDREACGDGEVSSFIIVTVGVLLF